MPGSSVFCSFIGLFVIVGGKLEVVVLCRINTSTRLSHKSLECSFAFFFLHGSRITQRYRKGLLNGRLFILQCMQYVPLTLRNQS